MMRASIASAVTLSCFAMVVGCCGEGTYLPVDDEPILQYHDQGGEVQVRLGETTLDLPESFPSDVPQPSGSQVQVYHRLQQSHFVTFTQGLGSADAAEAYQGQITGAGWTVQEELPNSAVSPGHPRVFTATKDDRQLFALFENNSVTLTVNSN